MEELYSGDIYIDEMGFVVKNSGQVPDQKGLVSPEQQVKYMEEFLTMSAADPHIKAVLIYHLKSSPDPNDLKTGLITSEGEKLPALNAVQKLL